MKGSSSENRVVGTAGGGQGTQAQKLAEKIKQDGYGSVRLEGLPAADWVVIDAGDVVIHLFRPEVRSFYNIERMWSFGEDGKLAAGTA